jgi:hypothetical protein
MASEFLCILHLCCFKYECTRRGMPQLQSNNDIRSTAVILLRDSILVPVSAMSHPNDLSSDTALKTPVLQRSSRILSTSTTHPSPIAYYPDQPRQLHRAPLRPCCTSSHTTSWLYQLHGPSLPPGFPCTGYYIGQHYRGMTLKRSI